MERYWASADRPPREVRDDSKPWTTNSEGAFNLALWESLDMTPMAPLDFEPSIQSGHDPSTMDLWSQRPAYNPPTTAQTSQTALPQPVVPSLTPDGDDAVSSCSAKTCGYCCEVAGESQACESDCESKVCDGYIDCNDPKDCPHSSVEEACHEDKSVCFDMECLREENVAEDVKFTDFADNVSQPGLVMLSSHEDHPFSNLNSWVHDQNSYSGLFGAHGVGGTPDLPRYPLTISVDDVCAAEGLESVQRAVRGPKRRKTNQSPIGNHQEELSNSVRNSISSLDDEKLFHDILHCHWGNGCDDGFTDRVSLGHHVFNQHIEPQTKMQQQFNCNWEDCQQPITVNSLASHAKRKHISEEPQDFYTCMSPGCDAQFPSEEELVHHLKIFHTPQLGMSCQWDQCGVQTVNMDDMAQHLYRDHCIENSILPPPRTSKESISPSVMSKNIHICQWTQLDASVKTEGKTQDIMSHNENSQEREPDIDTENGTYKALYEAATCNIIFESAEQLQNHVKDVHIAVLRKKPNYVCKWHGCQRKDNAPFSQKGKLERHLQVHTLYKASTCPTCGKSFAAPQALEQHQRTHTGEKPFVCDFPGCDKSFAQGSALTMHKRVHTGEKPLKCSFPGCNKYFSESSNLSKHRKIHESGGKYRCSFPNCDKSFHRRDQQTRHEKSHLKIRGRASLSHSRANSSDSFISSAMSSATLPPTPSPDYGFMMPPSSLPERSPTRGQALPRLVNQLDAVMSLTPEAVSVEEEVLMPHILENGGMVFSESVHEARGRYQ